jgi:hypothetical protein
MVLATSAEDPKPLNQMRMTVFNNGRFELVGDLITAS